MTLIDNSEKIKGLLKFSDSGVYIMYTHQRNKDKRGVHPCNASSRFYSDDILSYYFVGDEESFDKCFIMAKEEAALNNARVYLSTFRVDKSALMEDMDINITNEPQAWHFDRDFLLRAANFMEYRYYLADVDEGYTDAVEDILSRIKFIANYQGDGSILAVPTKNGYHIVSPPFNTDQLHLAYPFLYVTQVGGVMLYYFSEQD